jgi:hypothetical protein
MPANERDAVNYNLSRTNATSDLEARLLEIRMPAYERLAAQAHLARAEAIAELIVAAMHGVKSLAQNARGWWMAWPARRAS